MTKDARVVEHWHGELPVPTEWTEERIGKWVAIDFTIGLGDLIDLDIEGLNEYTDHFFESGVLTDLSYSVVHTADPDDEIGSQSILLRAEGLLEEF